MNVHNLFLKASFLFSDDKSSRGKEDAFFITEPKLGAFEKLHANIHCPKKTGMNVHDTFLVVTIFFFFQTTTSVAARRTLSSSPNRNLGAFEKLHINIHYPKKTGINEHDLFQQLHPSFSDDDFSRGKEDTFFNSDQNVDAFEWIHINVHKPLS
jgi:hypothetical protein